MDERDAPAQAVKNPQQPRWVRHDSGPFAAPS